MNITPRKSEAEALLSVLDEWDPMIRVGACSPEDRLAMAKALIKTVWASLLDRDYYVYAFRFTSGALTLPFGPFTSAAEAARFAKKVAVGSGEHVIAKVYGPAPNDRIASLYPSAQEATS